MNTFVLHGSVYSFPSALNRRRLRTRCLDNPGDDDCIERVFGFNSRLEYILIPKKSVARDISYSFFCLILLLLNLTPPGIVSFTAVDDMAASTRLLPRVKLENVGQTFSS